MQHGLGLADSRVGIKLNGYASKGTKSVMEILASLLIGGEGYFLRKEFAPKGSKVFTLRVVPICKRFQILERQLPVPKSCLPSQNGGKIFQVYPFPLYKLIKDPDLLLFF